MPLCLAISSSIHARHSFSTSKSGRNLLMLVNVGVAKQVFAFRKIATSILADIQRIRLAQILPWLRVFGLVAEIPAEAVARLIRNQT
jgi:hypothetical protein